MLIVKGDYQASSSRGGSLIADSVSPMGKGIGEYNLIAAETVC